VCVRACVRACVCFSADDTVHAIIQWEITMYIFITRFCLVNDNNNNNNNNNNNSTHVSDMSEPVIIVK